MLKVTQNGLFMFRMLEMCEIKCKCSILLLAHLFLSTLCFVLIARYVTQNECKANTRIFHSNPKREYPTGVKAIILHLQNIYVNKQHLSA